MEMQRNDFQPFGINKDRILWMCMRNMFMHVTPPGYCAALCHFKHDSITEKKAIISMAVLACC